MINNSKNFKKIKSDIANIFLNAEFELEGDHSLDTLRWVKKIDKNASESLQIAALAHDIDRAIPPKVTRNAGETYDSYKTRHSQRSSELIVDLMKKYNYPNKLIEGTKLLIKKHEEGGNSEADILRDADSISFFSCNLEWYYNYKNRDIKEVKREIIYKFQRATPRAQGLIKSIKIKNTILKDLCEDIFTSTAKTLKNT